MREIPHLLIRALLLTGLAIPACASRGLMTYKHTEVSGRPHFQSDGSMTTMWIKDGSRHTHQTMILWDDDVRDYRSIDASRHYQFELLEGSCVDGRGSEQKSCEIWRMYDNQRLIYDASFCRVHALTMPRDERQETIDAVNLPRGFDSAKARIFPNSRFDHAACNSPTYSSLDWTCPQCSEAETKWLEKHAKPSTP